MREDLEQKLARITELAEQKQQQAGELQGQLAGLRVTRKSGDGLLTATVTANGQLVDLRIDERALRNGRELAANLLNLVFQASAEASKQVQALAAPLLEDSSIDPSELGLGPTPPVLPSAPGMPGPGGPGAPGGPRPHEQPPQTFQQPVRNYPQPPPPPQTFQQPPPPARRPPVDDDPDEGGSIFRKDTW
ncbi:YbaB/EbfC family nucleoid-associated protein [Saccharothrix texasensis]|uniref:DNA-binding protein YbaB n=1 Tax=Saccharothrix texasensis TaxID=103734 RepID=A0A3N1H4N7_9PSEU|nr:YbaB/EbfC family nucleoid-associated protein [Saccharothrix texasensis]ROP37475.1 DNA-binding protein YbaB [Saccharothrix texasensis]